ncbi:MAG: hypothetical protein Aureis2KO_31750 [Aureisphaera sp.]
MIIGYSIIGLIMAALGGAAPGASNLAVIKTTTKDSFEKGMQIAIGAGLGEMMLAFMALCYSSFLSNFFQMNTWIQVSFMVLFLIAGMVFLMNGKIAWPKKPKKPIQVSNSKLATGFALSVLNPPVLLFWILGISITQKHLIPLSDMSPISVLTLFFLGVFLGKIAILYLYAKLGKEWGRKEKSDPTKLNRMIGIVLIVLASVQGIRFLIQ